MKNIFVYCEITEEHRVADVSLNYCERKKTGLRIGCCARSGGKWVSVKGSN